MSNFFNSTDETLVCDHALQSGYNLVCGSNPSVWPFKWKLLRSTFTGADLGGGCRGCPPPLEMTCGFLIQLVFTSGHQPVTPFLSGAPPPKKKSWIRPCFMWHCLSLISFKSCGVCRKYLVQQHIKVLLNSFHLNGHTLGFDPQTCLVSNREGLGTSL